MKELKQLSLNNNRLQGEIPLIEATQLVVLTLHRNELSLSPKKPRAFRPRGSGRKSGAVLEKAVIGGARCSADTSVSHRRTPAESSSLWKFSDEVKDIPFRVT